MCLKQWVTLAPWCSLCDNGRIKVKQNFWYSIDHCQCYYEARKVNNVTYRLHSSGLPIEAYKSYSVKDYKEDVITTDFLYKLVLGETKLPWLYLYGNPGTGKSYSAIIAMKYALALNLKVAYMNVPKLLDMLRPNSEWDNSKEIMRRCIDTDFLVLDDLWQEKPSSWVLERLYIIINERYMRRKPTIITSNESTASLFGKIGNKAIISRIRHLSVEVDFTGKDKRLT